MPPEDLRHHGREVIDWIADYLARIDGYPVLAQVAPGDVSAAIGATAPLEGTTMEAILEEFARTVLPGITHWNHPGFFAYFGTSGSGPGILGEALTAALNVNAMLWRTSPAATELEETAVGWLGQMLGLPPAFRGHLQDTASTSTLVAVAAAREATGLDIRETGMAGRSLPPLRLYCSEEAHSSVERAATTLGIGRSGTRKIPTDEAFRLRPDALARAIEVDREAGAHPFCVVATVGTTSTTSVDPVASIAEICRAENLWLHVDAAYAGAAAILPELRPHFAGWEGADSIVVNPHKWLFVPIDCSTLFLRDPRRVRDAFALNPEYLRTPEDGSVTNLMDFGPALGRRFRALKLWMTFRYFGQQGLAVRIRRHIQLAEIFRGWVEAEPHWECSAPTHFSTVCFRLVPPHTTPGDADRLNERILDAVNRSGRVFLSHTRVRDRFTLRLAIGNVRTLEEHVSEAWEILRRAAAAL